METGFIHSDSMSTPICDNTVRQYRLYISMNSTMLTQTHYNPGNMAMVYLRDHFKWHLGDFPWHYLRIITTLVTSQSSVQEMTLKHQTINWANVNPSL